MIAIAFLRLPVWMASMILGGFSFFVTLLITPKLIKYLKQAGITGKDMNKKERPEVAEMGGIAIIAGFTASLLPSIAVTRGETLINLLGLLSVTLIVSIIGILDDVLSPRGGISQIQHAILPLAASFPLIALRVGSHRIGVPFVGPVDFGLIYPLVFIPIGITCASNAVNVLGGMNGLRMGVTTVIAFTLGVVGMITSDVFTSSVSFALGGALLAFLYFNWHPAKVFPGDSGSLGVGAILGAIAIISNIEEAAVLLFVPHIIEFFIKARSKFQTKDAVWGIEQEDGSLKPRYEKIYTMVQLVMAKTKLKEYQIAALFIGIEVVFAGLTLLYFL